MVANFEIVTAPQCQFFFFLPFPLSHWLILLCFLGYVFSVLVPLYMMHIELETEYHGQVGDLQYALC